MIKNPVTAITVGILALGVAIWQLTSKTKKLTEAEQAIMDRINAYLEYGVDIRTEEEKQRLEAQTLNNMIDFIDKGGTYLEIPEDIRCDHLKEIYDKAFDIVFPTNIA